MSNSNTNEPSTLTGSPPINIATTRARRGSLASSIPGLSTSPASPLQAQLQTPASSFSIRLNHHSRARSGSGSDESFKGGPGGSPTSPLAYFLGTTSPLKTTSGAGTGGSFFGGKVASNPIDEDDQDGPPGVGAIGLFGVGGHTRRASWAQQLVGGAAPAPQLPTNDRGTGVMRRLSLSTGFQRPNFNNNSSPSAPPPSAISPSPPRTFAAPVAKPPTPKPPTPPMVQQPKGHLLRRAATLAVSDPVKKRGISPMGERLLKGQFDGF